MPISDLLLEDEPRRRPIFVSIDAQFVWDTAEELMFGERTPELLRLQAIAHRLERMDEQVRNLRASAVTVIDGLSNEVVAQVRAAVEPGIYAAGIIEGKRRMLDRSNLPPQSVELTPDIVSAIRDGKVVVKKIARGVSGLAVAEIKPAKPNALISAGIKLDMSGVK